MLAQRRREQLKEYEKQERRLKELKQSGMSNKQAQAKNQREVLTRKQAKSKVSANNTTDTNSADKKKQLIQKPKEYVVKVGSCASIMLSGSEKKNFFIVACSL